MSERRAPTAQERVDRALGRLSEIPAAIAIRVIGKPPAQAIADLESAAAGHFSTAMRYHQEATALQDEGRVAAWLEFAGIHAITAQALRAKAAELRGAA